MQFQDDFQKQSRVNRTSNKKKNYDDRSFEFQPKGKPQPVKKRSNKKVNVYQIDISDEDAFYE
jgi:hypothetical protein